MEILHSLYFSFTGMLLTTHYDNNLNPSPTTNCKITRKPNCIHFRAKKKNWLIIPHFTLIAETPFKYYYNYIEKQ